MFTVFVRGLDFYAYHGVSAEEQVIGHRYLMSLEMEVDGRADETDNVGQTVDYGKAGLLAVEIAQRAKRATVERVAAEVGDGLLREFTLLDQVSVSLAKALPPAPMIAQTAGVVVVRKRRQ